MKQKFLFLLMLTFDLNKKTWSAGRSKPTPLSIDELSKVQGVANTVMSAASNPVEAFATSNNLFGEGAVQTPW